MSDLVTIRPGLSLDRPAAESWMRMERDRGKPLDVNRSTVPRDVQMGMYNAWQAYAQGRGPKPNHGRAIHPDESWHCEPRARAVDTDDDVWIRSHPDYGWRFVVRDEKWHAQYYPEHDRYLGQEINDMGTLDNSEHNQMVIGQAIARALRYDARPNGYGADYRLGPTIWERLNQIEVAAKAGSDIQFNEDDVRMIADAIPVGIADKVIDALKNRL